MTDTVVRPPLPTPSSAAGAPTTGVGVVASFDRVLISVDQVDGALPPDGGSLVYPEPIRALSLNRLDTMEDSIPAAFASRADGGDLCRLYRYPSLPGLDRNPLSASARTVSTTNLETDLESMSPRVSTTTLSQDLDRDRFGLSLSSMPFLARSTSARMIEGLPPVDQGLLTTSASAVPPQFARRGATDLLSTPQATVHAAAVKRRKSCVRVVYRSASCPSLTEGARCHAAVAAAGAWVYRRRPVLRSQSPRADVNLEGEEIKDLPIEPRRNFPEFSPEATFLGGGLVGSAPVASQSQPLHRPSLLAYPVGQDGSLPASSVTPRPETAAAHARQYMAAGTVKNYFNVGEISSSFARPVFVDERFHKQRAPRLVQIKCLQWLNSLDSNR